jgi:hypothetical protein
MLLPSTSMATDWSINTLSFVVWFMQCCPFAGLTGRTSYAFPAGLHARNVAAANGG